MEVIAYKYILVISKGPVFQVYTVFRCVCVCVCVCATDVSSTTLLSTLGGVPPSLGVASSGGVAPMTYSCTPG